MADRASNLAREQKILGVGVSDPSFRPTQRDVLNMERRKFGGGVEDPSAKKSNFLKDVLSPGADLAESIVDSPYFQIGKNFYEDMSGLSGRAVSGAVNYLAPKIAGGVKSVDDWVRSEEPKVSASEGIPVAGLGVDIPTAPQAPREQMPGVTDKASSTAIPNKSLQGQMNGQFSGMDQRIPTSERDSWLASHQGNSATSTLLDYRPGSTKADDEYVRAHNERILQGSLHNEDMQRQVQHNALRQEAEQQKMDIEREKATRLQEFFARSGYEASPQVVQEMIKQDREREQSQQWINAHSEIVHGVEKSISDLMAAHRIPPNTPRESWPPEAKAAAEKIEADGNAKEAQAKELFQTMMKFNPKVQQSGQNSQF